MTAGDGAGPSPDRARAAVGRFWHVFAAVVVALRFPILIGWIAAAVAATLFLPGIAASGGIGGLIPPHSPALKAEADAVKLFGVPLAKSGGAARYVLIQRADPLGPAAINQVHALRSDLPQLAQAAGSRCCPHSV